ncbi:protein of unknown function [Kyrpidia spormannii]|uniref:Uncharacterized protein n=2 Tax=Kyrpidia spormannii TaxID=2055160 RepID=A0ACA8Z5N1_9BACL|nr:protein of unknown function [Kyrpidia spormannii]CAB3390380.1 protein of unknown function [Kyrpidia spormannii]
MQAVFRTFLQCRQAGELPTDRIAVVGRGIITKMLPRKKEAVDDLRGRHMGRGEWNGGA